MTKGTMMNSNYVSLSSKISLAGVGLAVALTGAACSKQAPAPAAAAAPAPVAAPATPIAWTTNAISYRGQVGATINVLCPPNGAQSTVWGSDMYSDDSSICTAALHSGRVTLAQGGPVSIVIAPGAPAYMPTMRNGVTTSSWGPWTGSFTIVGGPAPGLVATPVGAAAPAPTGAVDWTTDGATVAPGATSAVINCPPAGTADTIWGTDVYSSDSSVCTAAVHAGVITLAAGGPVRATGLPGAPSYAATTRNGISSQAWPAYSSSFRVEAAR